MTPILRIARQGTRFLIAGMLLLGMLPSGAAVAHEMRPAYLQMTETAPGTFDILFKTPMQGDLRLSLDVELSGPAMLSQPAAMRMTGDAMVQTWRIHTDVALAGRELQIKGLSNTLTDALVRVEFADGHSWVQRLTPASPSAVIPARQAGWQVALTYLRLGIEHILLGTDHLLFVLGLMMVAASTMRLVKAITAFTAAHSITLAAATLGFVHVPSRPVEAAIALSIVFVAVEVIHARQGRIGLAAKLPWLVAFGFGLLHGFGFAGALSEIGMPDGQIPTALLFFNVGVELGQLLFVSAVVGLVAAFRLTRVAMPRWTALVPAYAIGTVAMFWVIQRIAVA